MSCNMIDKKHNWQEHWVALPEYSNKKQPDPVITATFKFRNATDYELFKNKVKEHIYDNQKVFDGMQKKDKKQAWFPLKEKSSKYCYINSKKTNPRFPVYIVSKGRWHRNPTSKELDRIKVPYYIIVEEQEYDNYCAKIDKDKILILPQKYLDEYDTFWQDDDVRTGPGPARNFAWDHAIENNYEWHWVLDDNIESFERFNNNMKIKCNTGTPFYVCEEFVLRYKNIAQAGLQYANFYPAGESRPAYKLNTRIYSCLLIRNDIPYRWRGRYNEDTDLSLRILKDGWCTVQFNSFLQGKRATQTVKGGNSTEFYDEEGTLNKSKMLAEMHPDVAKVVWRFNRWHHHVNYNLYEKNELILKDNVKLNNHVNEYGFKLIREET
jgi:hypothetical protein